MNSQQAKAPSTAPAPNFQRVTFLNLQRALSLNPRLVSRIFFWGIRAALDLSDCAKLHALNLFDDYNSRMSAGISSKAWKPGVHCIDFDKLVLFNGLRRASIFSINQIVGCLVEAEGCAINQNGSMGDTPLAWAAWNGHEAIVKLLLGRADIDPDKPREDGRTPLMLASCNGHEGVVKMLLGRDDVNPDKPDNEGETPPLQMGMQEWWKYYSDVMRSTPTSQIMMA